MPKLPSISGKELIQVLVRHGFVDIRTSGSHFSLAHPDGRITTISVDGKKDLPKGTLKAILRDIQITNEELLKMLQ